jgi:hypothetical protein
VCLDNGLGKTPQMGYASHTEKRITLREKESHTKKRITRREESHIEKNPHIEKELLS